MPSRTARLFVVLLVSTGILVNVVHIDNETSGNIHIVSPGILAQRLYQHVWTLSETIGERHVEQPGSLEKAARYIEREFSACGINPSRYLIGKLPFRNVIAQITGATKPDEIIIVGAHYDTVWLSPGADDNASGVAAVLELACSLAQNRRDKTLRFVAFVNEEQPFSGTENMGSQAYVQALLAQKENVSAMISLEMLGYYSEKPHSQNYPTPLRWFYPDTGSFIAFVSNVPSSLLLFRTIMYFRRHSDFHAEGLIMPERLIPDIRRSDHASFWDAGYPALMVTDTSFYRNNNYHTVGDVVRTLDYGKMADVVTGLSGMLADFAQH